jgi:hypothetical protein
MKEEKRLKASGRRPEGGGAEGKNPCLSVFIRKEKVKVNVETALPLPEARKVQELSKTVHSDGRIVLEVSGR